MCYIGVFKLNIFLHQCTPNTLEASLMLNAEKIQQHLQQSGKLCKIT